MAVSSLITILLTLMSISYCDHNLNNELPNDDFYKDNSITLKAIKEDICRKKLYKHVREMCLPYERHERREYCKRKFRYKTLNKNERRMCRRNYARGSLRRKSISSMIRSCCQESCSILTLTKFCSPFMKPFIDGRNTIFGVDLPLFKPPQNYDPR